MYFKKLEIVGFKSFLDKTTLHFEPGITAIVGPNGCGKSNIFDSIRWVLGEQSVKSLRGSQMQDVIFNGTDSKEPLSMAEVSLTFDNSGRYFTVDHHEVVVTRRIFRSGESEYLLNKTQVRLKDILDLFMGTGIGAESYSLIEQGKIDLVLSSKPEDRRLIFDEASGITKYKAQKREALRKLEETEQNLLRVNDIIQEVKRQIGSLERQANKARRYKEVFEELKSKEVSLAVLQKEELLKQKNEITKQLTDLASQESGLLNRIQEQELQISSHQSELRALEDNITGIRNQILNLDNLASRNKERIAFNQERIKELGSQKEYLKNQIEQTRSRLKLDEEKLNNIRQEHDGIKKNIAEKTKALREKEEELGTINLSTKAALENIAQAKKDILELVSRISTVKNEVTDASSRQQIHLARKKRLDIEKAKLNEEKAATESDLKDITRQVQEALESLNGVNLKVSALRGEIDQDSLALNQIDADIERLEREKFTLMSQKEFLEKLKTKYEDISESMNAVIYLDKLPQEKLSGLVIKVKDAANLTDEDKAYFEPANIKLSGEAKPIDLNTQKVAEQIAAVEEKINAAKNSKTAKEARLEELNRLIQGLQQEARDFEMAAGNKKAQQQNIQEQFNKMNEEDEIITLELSDVQNEVSALEEKLKELKSGLDKLEREHKTKEELVLGEQNKVGLNSDLKEKTLISIAENKTELEALSKKTASDEATIKMLEDTYRQDEDNLLNLEKQTAETQAKQERLGEEIKDLEAGIKETAENITNQNNLLEEAEGRYKERSSGRNDAVKEIEAQRKEMEGLKNKLYEAQMQNKDIEFKVLSVKERILQSYKIELDTVDGILGEIDGNTLTAEIERLKEKLDSYGTVNLVAIEEYDELKKRYDFLNQQHNDLLSAKESLHEAILKINRTTKKMFLETFEKVREEFRNYFRLLFNGGDAQIFLIDEQDPLESGIEIICRPPGKKLQNVLLLSGGEKSMSAIALIFAIFKVKPSPFCVLDEIDAALDEANVDRFSRMLQEFTQGSQFIVITHNKKTIANADVMYGITMQESGVSKIVSVKFAQNKAAKSEEPEVAAAA